MRTFKRTSLLLIFVLSGVLACAVPGISQVSSNDGGTSAAQTVQAIVEATQRAGSTAFVQASQTATLTFTPEPPTLTPTETLTATPAPTITPLVPQISVSVPTNCRVGPGKIYDMVGALLVGVTVQVYARDPTGMYWYIHNPDRPNEFCWVWGGYATLTGLTAIVPVYTAQPTPTPTLTPTPAPAFDASYDGLVSCTTSWWPQIDLDNTGLIIFKSVAIIVKDTVTSTSVSNTSDEFVNNSDCTSSTSKSKLQPDKSLTISAPAFSYDPTGYKLRITLTLCSETGQNGTCVTDSFNFTP